MPKKKVSNIIFSLKRENYWERQISIKLNDLVVNLEESSTEIVDNEIKQMKLAGVNDIVSLGMGKPYFDSSLACIP